MKKPSKTDILRSLREQKAIAVKKGKNKTKKQLTKSR